MKKIKSEGNQLFNVPNTPQGKEFLSLAQKYLNRNVYGGLRKRCRGTRPKGSYEVTVQDAEWFAVYGEESAVKIRERCENRKQDMACMEQNIRRQVATEIVKDIAKVMPMFDFSVKDKT